VDGNLYNRAGTELCAYASGKPDTEFQLPSGVERLGDYAFSGANNVKSINLENGSLTVIFDHALYYCDALETLVIPNTVNEIGLGAIFECPALETLTIPYVGLKMSTNYINERTLAAIFYVATDYEENAKHIPKTLANLIITPIYARYVCFPLDIIKELPRLILPFNLTKTVLNASLVLLLYKPFTQALKATKLVPMGSSKKLSAKTTVITICAAVLLLIASIAVYVLVLGGSFSFFGK
jgi:hypothetical protein